MEIRAATIEDATVLFELANQLHESICVSRDDVQLVLAELLQRRDSLCLVVIVKSEVVGYLSGYIHPVLIQGGNTAYVDELVIRSDSRSKGLGTALMAQLEKLAKQRNCRLVGLATGGANAFYEQLGYKSQAGYYKKTL